MKEMMELTMMSDDELYRRIGQMARETMATLKATPAPSTKDTTAKAPFFFQDLNPASSPGVHVQLPQDAAEAGKTVCSQIGAQFDRVVCQTVGQSPLYGFKQETVRLGTQCVDALSREFPQISHDILTAFVALEAKQHFNVCNRW